MLLIIQDAKIVHKFDDEREDAWLATAERMEENTIDLFSEAEDLPYLSQKKLVAICNNYGIECKHNTESYTKTNMAKAIWEMAKQLPEDPITEVPPPLGKQDLTSKEIPMAKLTEEQKAAKEEQKAAKEAAKAEKAAAAGQKPEGPVSIIRRIVAANPNADRKTINTLCAAEGLNKGTVSIQVGKLLKAIAEGK